MFARKHPTSKSRSKTQSKGQSYRRSPGRPLSCPVTLPAAATAGGHRHVTPGQRGRPAPIANPPDILSPFSMRVQLDDRDEPVQVDPDQVEVEDEDPFLTQSEVDGIISSRLGRERRKVLEAVGLNPSEYRDGDGINLDELSADEAFQALARQQGIELREDGKPKGSVTDDELEELRKKASRVDELENKVSTYEEQIEGTRETKLENQLRSSAQGVRDDMDDVFLTYAKQRMAWDEEYGWHEVDENGDPVYENGQPKGPDQVVSEMEESKPSFFKDSSMSDGPSSSPSDESTPDETVSRSEFEDWSPEKQYEFTQEKGGTVVDDE